MEHLTLWLSFALVCLLGAMSPGPSLLIVTQHTLSGGRFHGMFAAWAHALGVGMYAVVTILGLHLVLEQNADLFRIITFLGAAYLAWLGIKALLSKEAGLFDLNKAKPTSLFAAGRDGILIAILNPKLVIFFTALFSQFLTVENQGLGFTTLVFTPFVIDGAWYTLVTLLLSMNKIFDLLKRHALIINKVCGALLLGLAMKVVINSLL